MVIGIAWVIIGYIVSKMAAFRGRHPVRWGVFGAITFLIAYIAIVIAGPPIGATRPAFRRAP